jgi:membrane fusion protein (multidrug efflux system)
MVKIGKFEIRKSWFTKRKIIAISVVLFLILVYFYYEEEKAFFMRPMVTVAEVKKERVPVYLEYVSNTVSKKTVDIRARVEGFLEKRYFTEGDDVKKGALLYVIDKRPFEASLLQAKGQLDKDLAALKYAREQVARYKPLAEKDYVSQENYDNYVTQAAELEAAVEADRGSVKQAELNLSWCTMRAPFSGRIGRTLVNVGNLVGAGGQDTKLATLVMLDPIYAYFSPADEELQRILKYMNENELKAELTLTDGTVYDHKGTLNFVDNEVNNQTSTIAMRVTVPNPDKLLMPGVYVDLKLYLDETDALLIPQKAIGEDQSGQYVMIVGSNDVVKKSYITTGAAYDNNVWVTKGVKEGEEVIVDGLQAAREGTAVNTQKIYTENTLQALIYRAVMGK